MIGTWVTGSGPHAGDHGAARNGLDPESISQVHVDLVFLLLGLSIALWFAFRAVGATAPARATLVLLAVEVGQGVIGFVQYFTGLPERAGRPAHARLLPVLDRHPGGAVVHPAARGRHGGRRRPAGEAAAAGRGRHTLIRRAHGGLGRGPGSEREAPPAGESGEQPG